MNINVAVRKLHPEATIPVYAKPGDAGFDFVAIEDVFIEPGQTVMIRTGLAFGIPSGFEIQVRPRSGVSAKHKLRVANAPGTIDSGFRGEVCIILENTNYEGQNSTPQVKTITGKNHNAYPEYHEKGTYLIRRGDRIAQGVLAEVPTAVFKETERLDETERGEGGFGSTGVNV